MDFKDALILVGIAEGAYTNDPRDDGGRTIAGLSQRANPDLAIWPMIELWEERGYTAAQIDKLARQDPHFQSLVRATYKGRYWNQMRCDELPPIMRYPVFNACVNIGCVQATKLLQKSAGVKEDGKMGPVTIRESRATDVNILYHAFMTHWREFYKRLVREKPAKSVYLNGWLARVDAVERDNHT